MKAGMERGRMRWYEKNPVARKTMIRKLNGKKFPTPGKSTNECDLVFVFLNPHSYIVTSPYCIIFPIAATNA